jgi:hypothetical protein
MKKAFIAIGSILIASIVIVTFVNAGNKTKDPVKQTKELCRETPKGPCCKAPCTQAGENKAAPCCKEKCQANACKPGEGKCNHEGCSKEGSCAKAEGKSCCKEGTGANAK